MSSNQANTCKVNPVAARLAFIGISLVALIISAVAAKSCEFIKIGYVKGLGKINLGLSSLEYNNKCIEYTDDFKEDNFEGSEKAARAFGALAPAVGGLGMVMLLCHIFMRIGIVFWRTIGSFFIFCFVSQLITFLIFNAKLCTENAGLCKMGDGAALSIVAALFWLALSIGMFVIPPPQKPLCDCDCGYEQGQIPTEPQTVEATKVETAAVAREITSSTVLPDGTKITKSITEKGGERIITEEKCDPNGAVTATTTVEHIA